MVYEPAFDSIAGCDHAFVDDAKIKPGHGAMQAQPYGAGRAHLDSELEARRAGLGDSEHDLARTVTVADTNLGFQHSLGGQVFAELAGFVGLMTQ